MSGFQIAVRAIFLRTQQKNCPIIPRFLPESLRVASRVDSRVAHLVTGVHRGPKSRLQKTKK